MIIYYSLDTEDHFRSRGWGVRKKVVFRTTLSQTLMIPLGLNHLLCYTWYELCLKKVKCIIQKLVLFSFCTNPKNASKTNYTKTGKSIHVAGNYEYSFGFRTNCKKLKEPYSFYSSLHFVSPTNESTCSGRTIEIIYLSGFRKSQPIMVAMRFTKDL